MLRRQGNIRSANCGPIEAYKRFILGLWVLVTSAVQTAAPLKHSGCRIALSAGRNIRSANCGPIEAYVVPA